MIYFLLEADFPDDLNVDSLVEFFESKDPEFEDRSHNLMVYGDIDGRKHVRKLVNRLGVDFESTVSSIVILKYFSGYLLE